MLVVIRCLVVILRAAEDLLLALAFVLASVCALALVLALAAALAFVSGLALALAAELAQVFAFGWEPRASALRKPTKQTAA